METSDINIPKYLCIGRDLELKWIATGRQQILFDPAFRVQYLTMTGIKSVPVSRHPILYLVNTNFDL